MTSPIADAPDTVMDCVTHKNHEDELTRRYPEASICYGSYTHEWFALVTDAHGKVRRLKAENPYDLAELLDAACTIFPDPLELPPPPESVPGRGRHARRRGGNRLLH